MQPFRKSQGGVRNFLFTPFRSLRLTFNYHCIQSIENDVEGGIIPRQLINSSAFFSLLAEHFPRNVAFERKTLFFVIEGFLKLASRSFVAQFYIFNSPSSFFCLHLHTNFLCECVYGAWLEMKIGHIHTLTRQIWHFLAHTPRLIIN